MDNFGLIYRILSYLEEAMDYEYPNIKFISPETLRITQQRWSAIMAILAHEKYVDGLTMERSAGGAIAVSAGAPRITLRGLEYLEILKRATGNRRPFSMPYSKPV